MGGHEGTNNVAARDNKLKGIGGWLLAISIIFLVYSVLKAFVVIGFLMNSSAILAGITPQMIIPVLTGMAIDAFETVMLFFCAILLMAQAITAAKVTRVVLLIAFIGRIALLVLVLLPFLFGVGLTLMFGIIIVEYMTFLQFFVPIFLLYACYRYFVKSRRVAATFAEAKSEVKIDPEEDVVMRYLK